MAGAPGAAGVGVGVGPGGVLNKKNYAFIKQLEEREAWIPLKVHEMEVRAQTTQNARMQPRHTLARCLT